MAIEMQKFPPYSSSKSKFSPPKNEIVDPNSQDSTKRLAVDVPSQESTLTRMSPEIKPPVTIETQALPVSAPLTVSTEEKPKIAEVEIKKESPHTKPGIPSMAVQPSIEVPSQTGRETQSPVQIPQNSVSMQSPPGIIPGRNVAMGMQSSPGMAFPVTMQMKSPPYVTMPMSSPGSRPHVSKGMEGSPRPMQAFPRHSASAQMPASTRPPVSMQSPPSSLTMGVDDAAMASYLTGAMLSRCSPSHPVSMVMSSPQDLSMKSGDKPSTSGKSSSEPVPMTVHPMGIDMTTHPPHTSITGTSPNKTQTGRIFKYFQYLALKILSEINLIIDDCIFLNVTVVFTVHPAGLDLATHPPTHQLHPAMRGMPYLPGYVPHLPPRGAPHGPIDMTTQASPVDMTMNPGQNNAVPLRPPLPQYLNSLYDK